jgi:hypothetical protein
LHSFKERLEEYILLLVWVQIGDDEEITLPKLIRKILVPVSATIYVPNITLHEDLNVSLVKEVIKERSTRYQNKIEGHLNILIQPLLEPHNERRLKRNWPADLREG